jgi:hypothetical protein
VRLSFWAGGDEKIYYVFNYTGIDRAAFFQKDNLMYTPYDMMGPFYRFQMY